MRSPSYCRVRAIATTVYFFYCNVYDGLFSVALSRKLVLLTRRAIIGI
ncbi:hypothetical protein [Nostoc sp.]